MDLIDRQQALDILEDYSKDVLEIWHGSYETARREMCELPAAQPECKTGHWIDKTDPEWDGEWDDWKCSCCGVVLSSMAINLNGTYLYCPKCGAKMEGV